MGISKKEYSWNITRKRDTVAAGFGTFSNQFNCANEDIAAVDTVDVLDII